jgi:deoxyribose-phosphate aldolase
MNIASYIDHTILKPETTLADIKKLCAEAVSQNFAAVCVPPYFVKAAKELTNGSSVKVATVIGFPFGYSSTEAKLKEIEEAIADRADELDIVHNITALRDNNYDYLRDEIKACTELCHQHDKTVKIIVESGILDDDELLRCCELYAPLGIDYMKTSTGYAATGATVHAVALMRDNLPESIHIKASGGIRTFVFAKELVEAGATRLGCSASMQIVEESKAK